MTEPRNFQAYVLIKPSRVSSTVVDLKLFADNLTKDEATRIVQLFWRIGFGAAMKLKGEA